MTHLGERVSALIDGQLNADATERVMAHLARCRECRDAVEIERLMKTRLACLPGPEPTGDLMGRLLAMGGPSGPLPPRPGHVPGTPRPKPVQLARPILTRPPARPDAAARVPAGVAASVVGVRPGGGRPPAGPGQAPGMRRPGVRRRRVRLAGAVLGALGVVGAGVGGLVLTAPTLAGGTGARSGTDTTLTIQQRSASPTTPTTPVIGVRGPRVVPPVGASVPALYHTGR